MQNNELCNDEGLCENPGVEQNPTIQPRVEIEKNGTIWYFVDPMCSWCWGISEQMSKLKDRYDGVLDFQLVMGGLRPGGGEEWNHDFKEFLRKHWNHVEMASGQRFNHDIFNLEEFDYDTEPACRAVVVARFIRPELAFDFLKKISHRFYVMNLDPKEDDFYKPICEELDIEFAEFKVLFHAQKFKKLTFDDFTTAKQFGVTGFPTVLLEHKKRYTVITRGFNLAERMEERIENVLQKSFKRELND